MISTNVVESLGLTPYHSKRGNFGKLFTVILNGSPAIVRKIEFKRLTSYVIEDFFKDLEHLILLKGEHFIKPIGISIIDQK